MKIFCQFNKIIIKFKISYLNSPPSSPTFDTFVSIVIFRRYTEKDRIRDRIHIQSINSSARINEAKFRRSATIISRLKFQSIHRNRDKGDRCHIRDDTHEGSEREKNEYSSQPKRARETALLPIADYRFASRQWNWPRRKVKGSGGGAKVCP